MLGVVQRWGGAGGGLGGGEAAPVSPWSPVNNCTQAMPLDMHPGRLFLPEVRRRPKVGRWHAWGKPKEAAPVDESAW